MGISRPYALGCRTKLSGTHLIDIRASYPRFGALIAGRLAYLWACLNQGLTSRGIGELNKIINEKPCQMVGLSRPIFLFIIAVARIKNCGIYPRDMLRNSKI